MDYLDINRAFRQMPIAGASRAGAHSLRRSTPETDWVSHVLPWTEFRHGFDLVRDKETFKVALAF